MGVVLLTIITFGFYPIYIKVVHMKKQTELLEQILLETKIKRGANE